MQNQMLRNTWLLRLVRGLFKCRTQQLIVTILALVVLTVAFIQIRSAKIRRDIQICKSQIRPLTYPHNPRLTIKLPSVCSNESCKSDYIKYFHRQDLLPIPAIRHIVWRDESVSQYMAEQLRSWVKIHPNWTFVLWRDQDFEVFVETYFPAYLPKFKSLPEQIMRVDAFRYLLLFKYGGVYADLDYTLVKSIEEFRHFHAVVTREPENHSFHHLPITWPLTPLANIAFMMSVPGHMLLHYAIEDIKCRAPNIPMDYAGPLAMTEIMQDYQRRFPIANHSMQAVYMPPSFSFYPYLNNRLDTSKSYFLPTRISRSNANCASMMSSRDAGMMKMRRIKNLTDYCRDVNNMDAITDKSQPVYAVHDLKKSGAFYYGQGTKYYVDKPIDIRDVIRNVKFAKDFI